MGSAGVAVVCSFSFRFDCNILLQRVPTSIAAHCSVCFDKIILLDLNIKRLTSFYYGDHMTRNELMTRAIQAP